MKPLRATPLVSHLSPDTFGEVAAYRDRALQANAILGDAAQSDTTAPVAVAQPWHGYENSAPHDHRQQISYHRITEARLVSLKPDRRLTGERTAEGWATGLTEIGSAAVASGDAKFSPRVRIQRFEPCRALPKREAEEHNLLP